MVRVRRGLIARAGEGADSSFAAKSVIKKGPFFLDITPSLSDRSTREGQSVPGREYRRHPSHLSSLEFEYGLVFGLSILKLASARITTGIILALPKSF